MTTWSIPPDTPVEWGPSQGAPSSGNVEWDSRMRQRASASSGRSSPVAQSYIALRCPLRSLALLCVVTIWSSLLGIAAACSAGGRAAAAARPWTLPSAADSDAVGAPAAIEGKPARRSGRCICFDVAFFFPVDIRRGRVKTPHGAFSNSGSPSPRPERQGQAAGSLWRGRELRRERRQDHQKVPERRRRRRRRRRWRRRRRRRRRRKTTATGEDGKSLEEEWRRRRRRRARTVKF